MVNLREFLLSTESKKRFISVKKESLLRQVFKETSFLDEIYQEIPINQRFWHIINQRGIERCKCGNIAKFRERDCRYVSCSEECKNKLIGRAIHNTNLIQSVRYRACTHEEFLYFKEIFDKNDTIQAIATIRRNKKYEPLKGLFKYCQNISQSKMAELIKNNVINFEEGKIISLDKFIVNLIDYYKTNVGNSLKSLELIDYVIKKTKFLDNAYKDIPNSQRYWHFKNNLFEIKKCEECNSSKAKYAIGRTNYICCSNECSASLAKKTFTKVFGVDNYSKTEEHKQKSANRKEFLTEITKKLKKKTNNC